MYIRCIARYKVDGHTISIMYKSESCEYVIHHHQNHSIRRIAWADCMEEVEEELIAIKKRLPRTKLTKARFDFFFSAVLRKGGEPKHETVVLD